MPVNAVGHATTRGRTIWWTNTRLTCALLTSRDWIHSSSCIKSWTHIGQHVFCSKQCKMAIIMSRTVFLMPPERPWTDSCTVVSCHPQLVGDRRPQVVWFVLWPQRQRCVRFTEVCGWQNLIPFSPQSLTKDPRAQSIAICNLDSALQLYIFV